MYSRSQFSVMLSVIVEASVLNIHINNSVESTVASTDNHRNLQNSTTIPGNFPTRNKRGKFQVIIVYTTYWLALNFG